MTTATITKSPTQFTKGTYFHTEIALFYIVEILEQHCLLEDCFTLDQVWVDYNDLAKLSVEVL